MTELELLQQIVNNLNFIGIMMCVIIGLLAAILFTGE